MQAMVSSMLPGDLNWNHELTINEILMLLADALNSYMLSSSETNLLHRVPKSGADIG